MHWLSWRYYRLNSDSIHNDISRFIFFLLLFPGVDLDRKVSSTFGTVNWAGSSIAIARKNAHELLPDVYVSRASPPSLIRIELNSEVDDSKEDEEDEESDGSVDASP